MTLSHQLDSVLEAERRASATAGSGSDAGADAGGCRLQAVVRPRLLAEAQEQGRSGPWATDLPRFAGNETRVRRGAKPSPLRRTMVRLGLERRCQLGPDATHGEECLDPS